MPSFTEEKKGREIKIVTILFAVAPTFMVAAGLLLGAGFNFAQIRVQGKKVPIPLIIFGMVSSIGLFLSAGYFSNSLSSIDLFASFAAIFEGISISIIKYNAQLVAVIILISVLEIGLASGFGLAVQIGKIRQKRRASQIGVDSKGDSQPIVSANESATSTSTITNKNIYLNRNMDVARVADEQGLKRDEQSLMELFLYGKVSQISSIANVFKPEGYYFTGIPQLDWETKRIKSVLDSLVRRGYLNAELTDKLIVCKACGSANIRIRKTCPECSSLRLYKEALLEHFTCGAVDRQTAFETENGDLVCPKCKVKLQLIGSDYRSLPPAYICLGCNTLNSEPLLTIKCDDCGSTAGMDEEPEIFLYNYTANAELPMQELQHIKPLDTCTKFFKSLGYNTVAPAFVSGRSGTQHLFDILILGRVGWVEAYNPNVNKALPRNDNGNTVVELLISNKPIDLEEITRIYGKISDIDCDFLLFAIPGLTSNARNYAEAYGMKVSEGRNIEEALSNSKIPKVTGDNAVD